MTEKRPDAGDDNMSTDPQSTPPEPEEAEMATEQPEEAEAAGESEAAEESAGMTEEGEPAEPVGDAPAADEEAAADVVAETEAEAADAAAAGAAWTTTPVAPDPEATEAALAALAAKPEVTLEPPETPPIPPGEEPEDEGTPVLLVGGILVGAFIVALAIVLILFRPFDNLSDVDASLSPSPAATEEASESPGITIVDTPSFVSLTLEQAEATAGDYGLVIRVETVNTDDAEPGTVLSQEPEPGEPVEEGSTIDLSVAQAVPTGSVPDVSGLSEEDAETVLDESGFAVGNIDYVYDDDVPAGGVISTDPVTDSELPEGSTVDLVVSQGPEQVAVPDIVDLAEADALDAIDDAGLAAGNRSEAFSDTIVAGNVSSSDPAADAEVAPGSEVDYTISIGPEQVTVPDIVDLAEADALDAIDDAGLAAGNRSEAFSDTIVTGNVSSSDPAADAEVAPGSEVDYTISIGPEQVTVPDIVDLAEADALDAIDDAGLAAGNRSEAFSDTIVTGNVSSSDPAADAEVAPGSEVDYTISIGPEQVTVPDIVDLAEADALDAIDDAGLAAGNRSEAFSDTIVTGNVSSSDPAADAEVAPGSEVDYTISIGPEQVTVPDIVDLAEADALDAIDDAGLAAGNRTEAFSDTIVAGNVSSSDPAADAEVAPGSEVDYTISIGPEQVTVPDIVDLAEADALDAIDDAGLAAGNRTEAFSDTIVAGNVSSSDPAADAEVAPGSEVDYTISIGPEQVTVPDIVDLAEADALDAIDDAGLAAGNRTEAFSDTIVAGNVTSTSPSADTTVDAASAVDYVISLGVETVAVPDLAGPAADAPDAISAAGLSVGDATQAYSDTVAAGDVISQSPSAGTEVELGTAVSYVESLGVEQAAVPDLAGPADEADARITAAGFAVGTTFEVNSDTVPAGEVNDQSPAAGEMAAVGSEVDYTISIGPEQVTVPDIVDLAEADALDAIDDAGLAAGNRTEAFSDTIVAGNVSSTSPSADTTVDAASAVDYVISLGVETVAVPDLAGPAADAPDAISAAGLSVGDATQAYSDTVAAGDVISQSPSAGTEVELGTAVSYVESLGVEQAAVPDLAGPADEADARITAAGFAVGTTFEVNSDTVPAGEVNDQSPAAGEMAAVGSEVDYTISIGPEQVTVPDIVDLAEADALDAIDDAGLAAGNRTEAFSDTIVAGNVTSTSPSADTTVDAASAVDYVISLGVETVAVPDLAGPAADAPDAISAAGLSVGDATQAYSDTVAAGDVISQSPSAGTEVELGTAVSYVESLGVEQAAVPDLAGPADEADARITAAGFAVGTTFEVNSDTVPAGEVNDQSPAAGEMAAVGSEVDYTISIGPEQVTVPDIVDLAEADALDAIDDAGLAAGNRTEAFSDTIVAGNVSSTSPSADTTVDAASAVDYVISLGVETVAVPDLAGPAADAPDAISAAGLSVGDATQAYSDTVAAGDVISQSPSAGTEVELGTAVSYVESLGVEQAAVPDLAGPADEADTSAIDRRRPRRRHPFEVTMRHRPGR